MEPNNITKQTKQELANFLLMCFNANKIDQYEVFFSYSGHVNSVSFSINKKGNYDMALYRDDIYISGQLFDQKKFKQTLKNWRSELMKILNPTVKLNDI